MNINAKAQLKTRSLAVEYRDGAVSITDPQSGIPLLLIPSPVFLAPWLDGAPAEVTLAGVRVENGALLFQYESPALSEMTVRFETSEAEDAVDFSCSFTPRNDAQLNRLDLFSEGTLLNFQEVVNFRNRHHTHRTWPELLLGGQGCETDTFSRDWQFAPHPTALLLRYNTAALFCGALDLSQSFGMYFAAADYQLKQWYLDFGTAPDGLALPAGKPFTSPSFRLFGRKDLAPEAVYAEFGAMLIRAGRIPDPLLKHREPWWQEPLYCTWVEQVYGSDSRVPSDLQEQAKQAGQNGAIKFLNERLVRKAVDEIEQQKYPFRTILIDDGWQVTRGQWEPDPARFPEMRKLVDELHAKGFKVVVWWNWAEIMAEAQADPAHLAGGGKLNIHGARVRDYSNPRTQDEYLKPLFHKLFSSEPGCCNLDGVKTDFLADKVHPGMPLHDPSWRGEENYFFHVTRLFYSELKKIKPDAIHIGCAGNYWLAEWIDINRTYDIASGNWRDHEERAKMLRATTPGCPVAFDFHNFLEGMDDWFASARRFGGSLQIGNIVWYRKNRFSAPEAADAAFRKVLHDGLGGC